MIGVIAVEGGWRAGTAVFGTAGIRTPFGELAVVPLAANASHMEPEDGPVTGFPFDRPWR